MEITFRKKTPEEVIALSVEAGLAGIEWGSDVHVLPGDLDHAKRIGELTRTAGLEVAGYGSYWFARDEQPEPEPFEPLIETALALGTPVIRIWAGSLGLEKNPEYLKTVVGRSRFFAEAAAQVGLKLAYEYHPNTFTETLEGAQKILAAVDHPNLYTYWQPPHDSGLERRLAEITSRKNETTGVFQWLETPAFDFPIIGKVGDPYSQQEIDRVEERDGGLFNYECNWHCQIKYFCQ